LVEARVNPKSLQQVMELFDVYLTGDLDLTWASTHPSPSDRKAYIEAKIETLSADEDYVAPIQSSTWKKLQSFLANYSIEVD